MPTKKVVLHPLPHKVKGFICADEEGGEVFILNSRLTTEANRETMIHEIKHCQNNDMYRQCRVNSIERERHRARYD